MNLRFASFCLASLGCAAGLVAPLNASAAKVGYYGMCSGATPSAQIVAAGHVPVELTELSASQLIGIDLLYVETCESQYLKGAAVDDAVSRGMTLLVTDNSAGNVLLPGDVYLAGGRTDAIADINFTSDAPYLTGPGGVIDSSSLDSSDVYYAAGGGAIPLSFLPAGSVVFATSEHSDEVMSFSYPRGNGRVVHSTIAAGYFLQGGYANTLPGAETISHNVQTFVTNMIAWALRTSSRTTCASEGYTGTKLTWCQNICEKGYTGSTLNSWIKRWTDKYRDLPYCAREK